MTKKAESFIVTVDKEDNYHVVDSLELNKYAEKAAIDPATLSKQVPSDPLKVGKNVLNPKYNPHELVQLLDLYTYHAACVEAVATDASGVGYSLKPIEGIEPVDAEKQRFIEVLENSTPSINIQAYRMIYDRRSVGYGAIEVIREDKSKSPIVRLKHIPAHTLRRHTDTKRVLHTASDGKKVWYVLYSKNYDDEGNLVDVHADTGAFHPYNSLPTEEKANELLWTLEYAPGTNYYGRPPVISCLKAIKGDISAINYNNAFFDNHGMPKFAITITGDFQEYDEEPYIETYDDNGKVVRTENPNYDFTQTLRYKINQQIKEVIKNPHSAICLLIPSDGQDGNVKVDITPLSVQTEEGHFRMFRKDVRDEVIHSHHLDPSRLGIFDAGNLNGTNSQVTQNSYQYGTVAPIKNEIEAIINQIGRELGVTSWRFVIEDVTPVDYTKKIELATFLFERGAMTIMDLINNFGAEFGLSVDDVDDYYLNSRYLNFVPLEQVWNNSESNAYLENNSILTNIEDKLWGDLNEERDISKEAK